MPAKTEKVVLTTGSPVKLVLVCLCVGSTLQRHFHRRGGGVKHVQACLRAENTLKSRFKRGGGAVKHVQACLSVRKDGESRFHHCGGDGDGANLFMCGKHPTTPF